MPSHVMKRIPISPVRWLRAGGALLAVLFAGGVGAADQAPLPFVSPMFGDNMVLQRGKTNTIWGWTQPGQEVRVAVAGRSTTGTAGADGRWQVRLLPPESAGPLTLRVSGPQTATFTNVLVGDVWLCGGQSNMELPLRAARNGEAESKAAHHPDIRLFTVAHHVAYAPAAVVAGSWKVCSPETIAENGGFSAVGYFFGRKLQTELHVPVGLIQDCVGGTPAESWMSPSALHALGDFEAPLAEMARLHARGGPEYGSFLMHWLDEYDLGSGTHFWGASALDEADWKPVTIPGGFRELGVPEVPSVCWFRREIILPDPLPAGPAMLFLGSIEKMDTAYVNGQWVGASSWVENPRVYFIKNGVLHSGTNTLAVRIFKLKPDGGFLAKPETLRLRLGDKSTIPLAGAWRGRLSVDARPPHPLPMTFENYPTMPVVLYHGMLQPVAPLALRGAIWYQGEANFLRAHQYRTLLPALIRDWRALFQQGDFPFYIVSLPAFMHRREQPGDDAWAELREAQALTAQTVTNTALAVTVDTGDADNIHPPEKQVVGERLARCALAQEFARVIPYRGPEFASMTTRPGVLVLRFRYTDGGLVAKSGALGEFSVAGKDRHWHWAQARIAGDAVVVSSPDVPEPVAARYAWQANPAATLFNGAGLPAVPFRTDDWPGATDHAQPW